MGLALSAGKAMGMYDAPVRQSGWEFLLLASIAQEPGATSFSKAFFVP